MSNYKCFECEKEVDDEYLRSRVRCPYCSSRILYKKREKTTKVKAR